MLKFEITVVFDSAPIRERKAVLLGTLSKGIASLNLKPV
jgi:hypothetical protein